MSNRKLLYSFVSEHKRKRKRQSHRSESLPVTASTSYPVGNYIGYSSMRGAQAVSAPSMIDASKHDQDQLCPFQNTQCPHCPESLPWNALKQHISQLHGHEMPFVCSLCYKGFLTSSGLNNHMQAHEGRKFMCPICDFRFKQKGHLKQHLKSIHKLAQCTTCAMTFGLGDEFNQHVLHCI
jgi:hypothetical protein